MPERAGGQAERAAPANRHDSAGPDRARTAGSTGRRTSQRARGEQRDGRDDVDAADQPAQAVDRALAHAPAVPAEPDDEGEEDGDGDQAEADQVEVALLEHGHARRPGLAGWLSGGRGLARLAGWHAAGPASTRGACAPARFLKAR